MINLFKGIAIAIIFELSLHIANGQCLGGWAKQGGSPNDHDRAFAVATDNSGNVYVAGHYTDTAVFSGITLISSSYEDIFLAKYDANGNLLWIKSAGGYNIDAPSSIALDNNNNIYMTGVNFGTAVFDTITLNNTSGFPNGFAAKYDSAGNVKWAKSIGNTDWDQVGGIAVLNNDLYICGTFSLSIVLGSTTLTSYGQRDFFIAKMDLNGNYLWAHSAGSAQNDGGVSLAIDGAGNIFVTGSFFADMTIGSTVLINQGYYDMFLAKYDNNGNMLWAKSAGGYLDDFVSGLAIDSGSNIYVSMGASTACIFGPITVNTYGDKDIMLARYDSSGNIIWVENTGGINRDIGGGVVVANNNKIYQTGHFEGNATFGTVTLNLPGIDYIFLAEYDSSGIVNSVKHAGGVQYDHGSGVACDNNSNVYVCGNFINTASFDLITLTADTNGGDAFIWKACNGITGIDTPAELIKTSLYPNPFYDLLNIRVNNNELSEVIIYEITSRKILYQRFANSVSLNTKQLAKGIYIYEIRNKNNVIGKGETIKE
ncbi:MAG TPA: SBBP repeat-containing protein [Bacteroidia bacterium]|nr:SBBP repeat-containing protein [Bacteroidia bacterium]